ncbi:hypothetical protein [Winogradskyella sp. PC D3.3]
MKKIVIILIIISSNFSSFSQTKTDYNIILKFDSLKKEIYIKEFNIEGDQLLAFNISKTVKDLKPVDSIGVDENGKLQRYIKGSTSWGCCSETLYYYSKIHKQEKILRINSKNNIITYKDFMNVSFENFSDVVKNAKKVYVVDSSKCDDSMYYDAYEVSFTLSNKVEIED